jgi:hypothetical protein
MPRKNDFESEQSNSNNPTSVPVTQNTEPQVKLVTENEIINMKLDYLLNAINYLVSLIEKEQPEQTEETN